jgi:hypothetical protein
LPNGCAPQPQRSSTSTTQRPGEQLFWIEDALAIDPEFIPRRGYGTELIQEALAYALQAQVD